MRIIFSIYVNFDDDDFDKDYDYKKNIKNKNEFKTNYNFLKNKQEQYARQLGIPYILYENDKKWKAYRKHFEDNYPFISKYNIINFYKIHIMYDLCRTYDEILYIDFDVVPLTPDNIFDSIDVTNGIACRVNHERNPESYLTFLSPKIIKEREKAFLRTGRTFSERDPKAKYWNCRALLMEEGLSGDNDVYNTGIVLANKDNLKKLNYFKNFDDTLKFMHRIKNEEGFWPKFVQNCFGYDNETLFSFKMKINNVNLIELDDVWHFPYRKKINYIPKETKFVHAINKNFKFIKAYAKRYNL